MNLKAEHSGYQYASYKYIKVLDIYFQSHFKMIGLWREITTPNFWGGKDSNIENRESKRSYKKMLVSLLSPLLQTY
jgi:hypothetical protein